MRGAICGFCSTLYNTPARVPLPSCRWQSGAQVLKWWALTCRVIEMTMLQTAGFRAQPAKPKHVKTDLRLECRLSASERCNGDSVSPDCTWLLPCRQLGCLLSCQGASFVPMLVRLLLFPLLPFPRDHKPAYLLLCSSSDRSTIQSSWQETNSLLSGLVSPPFPSMLDVHVPQSSPYAAVAPRDWSSPAVGTQLLPSSVLGAGLENRES